MDRQVRGRLAQSIGEICDAIAALSGPVPDLTPILGAIVSAPVPPSRFAQYGAVARAAHQDDLAAAAAALREFARPDPGGASADRVVTVSDAHLGAGMAKLYADTVNDDPDKPMHIEPVDAATVERMRALFDQAMSLIHAADPDLLAELDVLARQIVLADGRAGPDFFGGAATFFLWGALIVNPRFIADRLDMAEALAHEAAHSLLFGLVEAENLTLNPPDETFSSPLRMDPRPMEGIYHATFVLARMIRLLERIRGACALNPEEAAKLDKLIADDRERFAQGARVVAEHARLTAEGRAIFDGCVAAMAQPEFS